MRSRQILCPTDFSTTASHALGYAVEMANFYKVGIHLVHVLDKPFGDKYAGVLSMTSEELVNQLKGEAAEHMREWAGKLECEMSVEGLIRQGDIVEQILQSAKTTNAGMIVIASHGHTGLTHFLHANVAESVANGAECPVLVVK